MVSKKRDAPKTPAGKTKIFTTGGKAGRSPGLGNRNNSGLTPGQGTDRPAQGYGLTAAARRKPPLEERPQPKTKPDDESRGGESGN